MAVTTDGLCDGDVLRRHRVRFEDRISPQPWICYRCNRRVIADRSTGRFTAEIFIIEEDDEI